MRTIEWAAAGAFMVGLGLAAGVAVAAEGTRRAVDLAPPKDCTRFNGRAGYHGNPWCSVAEQRAWDLWEARQLRGSGKS